MMVRRMIYAGAFVVGMIVIGLSPTVDAVQSQLTQEVKPFECIYTTTQTGNGESTIDNCQGQHVPTVEDVIINSGRPVIKGTFRASSALSLRVWINSRWYTYGTDARLSVLSDEWTLDLSNTSTVLISGNYEVVVEVETVDGLLLRHVSAATFYVPVLADIPNATAVRQPNVVSSFFRELFSVAPNDTPVVINDRQVLPLVEDGKRHPISSDDSVPGSQDDKSINKDAMIAIVTAGVVLLAAGVIIAMSNFRLRP